MPVQIREPISVAVLFEHGAIKPVLFRWNGKKIEIEKTSFTWETRQGVARLLHFSVVCRRNIYELVFNLNEMTWRLETVATES